MHRFKSYRWILPMLICAGTAGSAQADVRIVPITVDGLVYNKANGKFYGGVTAGVNANTVIPIDPVTATTGRAVALNSKPQRLVISTDGRYVYNVVGEKNQISRYDTQSEAIDKQWSVGAGLYVEDLVAVPGSPGTVIVSRANTSFSPRHEDLTIYDNGVPRANAPAAGGANLIEIKEDGTELYGYQPEISSFDFSTWDLDSTGLSNHKIIHPFSYNADFVYVDGRCYSSHGKIFDPHTGEIFGGFSSVDIKMILPDPASNRLFTAEETRDGLVIKAQDLTTLTDIGTLTIPDVPDNPGWLLRWGTDGLAFRAGDKLYLIRDLIVGNTPPVVTAVTPNQGYRGDTVVITGEDFTSTYSIKFDGYDANFTVDSDTQITTSVPLNATTGPITIASVGGKTTTPSFTVLDRLLTVNDVSISEGNSGTKNLAFNVKLSAAHDQVVSFKVKTVNGSATAGQDYTAVTKDVTIPVGQTSVAVEVSILGDTNKEADETLNLEISDPVNALIGDGVAVGTIVEDDIPALSIENASITEGNSGTTDMVFTVELSEAGVQPVTFKYATANNTARTGEDFVAKSASATIPAGQLSTTIAIPINGDTVPEGDELFKLNLTDIKGASPGTATANGTIINDDVPPTLSVNSVTVTEANSGKTAAVFVVSLSEASSQTITVKYATVNGTAVAGQDFTAATGSLTFLPGEKTKEVTINVAGDVLDEANEQFGFKLSDPKNATLLVGQGSGTITDDDAAPSLTISPVSGLETLKSFTFAVTLSAPSGKTVKVAYSTANITAKAKADYLATAGDLVFAPGATTKTIVVPLKNDTQDEDNETFAVNLVSASNASVVKKQGIGTIFDDDGAPSLSLNDISIIEGNAGTLNAAFTVRLSMPSSKTVIVDFATINGTAISPADFNSRSGKLIFAPGQVTKSLGVQVKSDLLDELNEQFQLKLSGAVNASIADEIGIASIRDNDSAPLIVLDRPSVTEGDTGPATLTFTVKLTKPSGLPIKVDYKTTVPTDNPATPGVDYTAINPGTLNFAPGETSKTVSLTVLGDIADEADERVNLVLSAPVNVGFTGGKAANYGTIIDNDATPTLSINDVTIVEGDSGTKEAKFTITLSAASGREVDVDFMTVKGTASSPSDFTGVTGSWTFAPGETTKIVAITIKGDTLVEASEGFLVVLSKAVNAKRLKETGVGTITNDDIVPRGSTSIAEPEASAQAS